MVFSADRHGTSGITVAALAADETTLASTTCNADVQTSRSVPLAISLSGSSIDYGGVVDATAPLDAAPPGAAAPVDTAPPVDSPLPTDDLMVVDGARYYSVVRDTAVSDNSVVRDTATPVDATIDQAAVPMVITANQLDVGTIPTVRRHPQGPVADGAGTCARTR